MESTVFLIVLGLVLAACLLVWLALPPRKGARGERVVHSLLRQSLHPSEYAILRDVTLPYEGGTTQIDHVVVSRFGIFVIETKNLAGWIYGAETDSHWTQSFGHFRVEFHNPLRQNHAHLRALQALLGLRATKFHSLVVFTGKSEFKREMPLNVLRPDRLVPFIEVRRTLLLTTEEADRSLDLIESSRLQPGLGTEVLHVESLRARRRPVVPAVHSATPARAPLRLATHNRVAFRALAGAAVLALLLSGTALIGGIDGYALLGGTWPTAYPTRSAARLAPASLQPLLEPAPGASDGHDLRCTYAPDARTCACYYPAGEPAPIDFEECKALADNAAR
ncbi:MAG: nuclease-related domain-containing protein [Lysobacterales bacterium]